MWRLPPAKELQLWQAPPVDLEGPGEPELDHLSPTTGRTVGADDDEAGAPRISTAAHTGPLQSRTSERLFAVHGQGPKGSDPSGLTNSGNQARGASKAKPDSGAWQHCGALPDDGQKKQRSRGSTPGDVEGRPRSPDDAKESFLTPFEPKSDDDDEELDDIRSALS